MPSHIFSIFEFMAMGILCGYGFFGIITISLHKYLKVLVPWKGMTSERTRDTQRHLRIVNPWQENKQFPLCSNEANMKGKWWCEAEFIIVISFVSLLFLYIIPRFSENMSDKVCSICISELKFYLSKVFITRKFLAK